jgi:hypothetical protein
MHISNACFSKDPIRSTQRIFVQRADDYVPLYLGHAYPLLVLHPPTGHGIRPIDVIVLKKFSEVLNVVSVVAKAKRRVMRGKRSGKGIKGVSL